MVTEEVGKRYGMKWEIGITHILSRCKIVSRKLQCSTGSPARRSVIPYWAGGWETPEEGDVRIHLADSSHDIPETNITL